MTKYKTDAEKLKFFREAREARIPKATVGRIMRKPFHIPIKVEEDSTNVNPPVQDSTYVAPDLRTEEIKRQMLLQGKGSPFLGNTTQGELQTPKKPMKKGGFLKRKKK